MARMRARLGTDTGAALISALMMVVLMAGLTATITVMVISDTQVRSLDSTRTQSFYSAHAGLEKLTADLGDLFSANFAPTAGQINALMTTPPAIGVTWQEPDGTNGYRINYPTDAGGNPAAQTMTVMSGPFQGLVGLATAYQMTATARLPDRSEASLTRTLQTVAIPVFQFGIFSENDLSFFAGPNFNFGGRVHTNSNLFLASGNASTLTLADRVTTVGEIVRTNLSNGWDTATNYTGPVNVIRAPGLFRALARTEASLVGNLGSATNEPTWTNLSTGTYNHNIANGRTGAKRLDLPVTSFGAQPIALIQRPAVNEDTANPNLLGQRFFSMASLRILLSDTAADITSLPTVTATAPIALSDSTLLGAGYTGQPFALSPGPNAGATSNQSQYGVRSPNGTPLLGGFIKIEKQTVAGTWVDITLQMLNYGIAAPQLPPIGSAIACAAPAPNAIVRLERVRDRTDTTCITTFTTTSSFSPLSLYDTREGILRDAVGGTQLRWGGVVHYVELDARNLTLWFQGLLPGGGVQGTDALNVNGFTVYFSDRRNNHDAAGAETGEFGFEDLVNPASGTGTPNGVLDTGEDFNDSGTLQTYGQTPRSVTLTNGNNTTLTGWTAPVSTAVRPWTAFNGASQDETAAIARRNPAVFFRRALKVVRGNLGLPAGLTISAENPVYVQGDWNANGSFVGAHSATAFLGDALTLLSNNFNDRITFMNPNDTGPRDAATTWYRFAVIAGKGISFAQPAGTGQDYGTDGGAHNFLRYIEDWGGQTLNFRGSIVSLYRSRQATGTFKCCTSVYAPPTRGYNFDTDFLTPSLLPPRTPMFRDVNTTGFQQLIRAR